MQILSETQIYAAAKAAGFSPAESVIATAIAMAESGGDPAATHHNTNGSTDYGLWQINSVHADLFAGGANWADPVTNARMAHSVYQSQGWHAWSTYNSGAYLKRMDSSVTATNAPPPTASNVGFWDTAKGAAGNVGGALGSVIGGDPLSAGLPQKDKPNAMGQNPGGIGLPSIVPDWIKNLGSLLGAVMTVEFWERAGWGLLGFFLVLFGFIFLVESNKTARTLTETAALA